MAIINEVGLGSSLGQAFGTGLGEGLSAIANQKINKFIRENNYKRYDEVFKKAGYNPGVSQLLSHLAIDNPQGFHHILETLGAGTGIEQPMAQEGQNVQGSQSAQNIVQNATSAPQETSFAQQFARGVQSRKPSSEDKEAQKELNKFLQLQQKKYTTGKDLANTASDALRILEKEKKNLPSVLTRNFPQKHNPLASSGVRTLEAAYNKIIQKAAAAEATGTGSRVTNAMLKLAEMAKASLNQPYETQKEILEGMIKYGNELEREKKLSLEIKKKHGGKYPTNLADLLAEAEFEGEEKGIEEGSQEEYQKRQAADGSTEVFDPAMNRWRKVLVRGA